MKYETHQIIIAALILTLCFAFFPDPAPGKENAALTKVNGDVKVLKSGEAPGLSGAVGMPISAGDKIVTKGAGSSADITFPNGDVARVMPDSTLEIKESYFRKKTSRTRLKLLTGKIFNVVRKFTGGSKYEVETPTAVAGVRGTTWSAETKDGEKDVFMVKEGVVAAANPAVAPEKEVLVSALRKTVVQKHKAPSKPAPMTPEEIAMFDILDDLFEEITEEIRDEIKDEIAEDIIDQVIGH